MPPGMFLSQPPIAITPSSHCPFTQVSMQSAITSRDTSEYFMPSVPMAMPSEMDGTPKTCALALPSVIALKSYVNRRYEGMPLFSRRHLFLRDMFTCAYCQSQLSPSQLTYDHVVPRSLEIAADICVYTNGNLTVETIGRD